MIFFLVQAMVKLLQPEHIKTLKGEAVVCVLIITFEL